MAGNRNWDGLSPAYRKRLLNGGITRARYEAGHNLRNARGHGQTPEHPGESERNKDRYKEYRNRKNDLVNKIQAIKIDAFSDRIKWNEARSKMTVKKNPETGKLRGVKELRELLAYITEWDELDRPEDWEGLVEIGGTEETENAFYYH